MAGKRSFYIMFLVIAGCLIMAWVDAVLSPDYVIKSIIKLVLFLMLPLGYALIDGDISFRDLFAFDRRKIFLPILLGVGVYFFILSVYFIAGSYFDLSNVTAALQNNVGVNRDNFVFVALYISFINSLLEEFFFRGFAFLILKKVVCRRGAYLFSAGIFSLYHIAIMTNWFTPSLFTLLIVGLFIAGLLFNCLNEKGNNIYTSWLVHMCANFAINTVGFLLFDIL